MATDLHDRILAEIERREQVARAAEESAPSPWRTEWHGQGYGLFDADGGEVGEAFFAIATWEPEATQQRAECDVAYIDHHRDHDPTDALRRYAHYRRVLDRHGDPGMPGVCDHCGMAMPCFDIRDVADALGIPVEETANGD